MPITDEQVKRHIPGMLRAIADKCERLDALPESEENVYLFVDGSRVEDHETGQVFFSMVFAYLSESKNERDQWGRAVEALLR